MPWVVAHRGASASHPENTFPAFDAALEAGADGIEFDVQLTADGVPIVYHDRTLHKLSGRGQRVCAASWAELQRVDAGAWLHRRFAGVRIPLLDDVLDRYGSRCRLMLEIKLDAHCSAAHRNALVDRCVSAVQMRALEEKVFFLSFDRGALRRVRRRDAFASCVWNMDATPQWNSQFQNACGDLHAVCMPARAMRRALRERLSSFGVGAWVYRCDTERHLSMARRWQVDAVITDWPAWASSIR